MTATDKIDYEDELRIVINLILDTKKANSTTKFIDANGLLLVWETRVRSYFEKMDKKHDCDK